MQAPVTHDVAVGTWTTPTGTTTIKTLYGGVIQREGTTTPWLALSPAVTAAPGTEVTATIKGGEDDYATGVTVNAFLILGADVAPGSGSPAPIVSGSTILLASAKTGDGYASTPTTLTATVPASGGTLYLGAWGEREDGFTVPTLTTTAPDTPPDPEPEPEPTSDLGERVAKFLGKEGDPDVIQRAAFHAEIVTDYVYGYTRGRGFIGDTPERPLRSVIVAATARLTGNPEQVSYYVTGDYSERPAVLSGWLLHELQTLNKYRRRWA